MHFLSFMNQLMEPTCWHILAVQCTCPYGFHKKISPHESESLFPTGELPAIVKSAHSFYIVNKWTWVYGDKLGRKKVIQVLKCDRIIAQLNNVEGKIKDENKN